MAKRLFERLVFPFWPTEARLSAPRVRPVLPRVRAREVEVGQMTEIGAGVDGAVRAPALVAPSGLHRGRTWMLAVGDAIALVVAYAASYVVATSIAPLPPVSAPSWFLALLAITAPVVWPASSRPITSTTTTACRISVSSFDEIRDLFHAMLAGSLGYLIVSRRVRVLLRLVDLQRLSRRSCSSPPRS